MNEEEGVKVNEKSRWVAWEVMFMKTCGEMEKGGVKEGRELHRLE